MVYTLQFQRNKVVFAMTWLNGIFGRTWGSHFRLLMLAGLMLAVCPYSRSDTNAFVLPPCYCTEMILGLLQRS